MKTTTSRRIFSSPRMSVLALALLLGYGGLSQAAAKVDHVFIISLDQGSPDVIAMADMPRYKQLAAEGARTWEAYDTADTARWLLGLPIPEDFWGHPVTTAFETR